MLPTYSFHSSLHVQKLQTLYEINFTLAYTHTWERLKAQVVAVLTSVRFIVYVKSFGRTLVRRITAI